MPNEYFFTLLVSTVMFFITSFIFLKLGLLGVVVIVLFFALIAARLQRSETHGFFHIHASHNYIRLKAMQDENAEAMSDEDLSTFNLLDKRRKLAFRGFYAICVMTVSTAAIMEIAMVKAQLQ